MRLFAAIVLLSFPLAAAADLAFVGEAPTSLQVLEASGQNVTLSEALRRVAPKGWTGYAKKDAGVRDLKVSWDDGQTWLSALDRIAERNNLRITVNWESHVLSVEQQVTPLRTVPTPAKFRTPDLTGAAGAPIGENLAGTSTAKAVAQAGPDGIRWVKPQAKSESVVLKPGAVSEAYTRVAEAHGYKLDWRVKEDGGQFQFDNPVMVPGALLAEDLAKLNESFMTANGQQLFTIEVWEGNRIILVKSKD